MWRKFNINDEVFVVKTSNLLSQNKCDFITGKVIKKGSKWITILIDDTEIKFNSPIMILNGLVGCTYRIFKSEEEYYELIELKEKKEELKKNLDKFSTNELKDILNFVEIYMNTSDN